jgi:hypothetical protein
MPLLVYVSGDHQVLYEEFGDQTDGERTSLQGVCDSRKICTLNTPIQRRPSSQGRRQGRPLWEWLSILLTQLFIRGLRSALQLGDPQPQEAGGQDRRVHRQADQDDRDMPYRMPIMPKAGVRVITTRK